jgi:hypothetical protein
VKITYIWLLFAAGAIFSCKKRDGNIVIDGQGDGSKYEVFRTDTLSIFASTIPEDSLPGNGLPYNLIGTMTDPLLGKTTANLYAAASIYEPNSDFPNTETPDSAVLYIPIIDGLNFYGDRISDQTWKIYPLAEALSSTAVYYQNSVPKLNTSTSTTYRGKVFSTFYDTITFNKQKLELHPGIYIKLSADMARTLMQMPKEAYQSDANLNKYFPGLAILPQDDDLPSGKGGIGVYDIEGSGTLSTRAHILLYYRDSLAFAFTFSGASRTITSGKTGPFPGFVQTQLSNQQLKYSTTYIQSLSGLKSFVRIPHLLNLTQGGNIAVNKATITFFIDQSTVTNNFSAPPRLNLFRPPNGGSRRNYVLSDATTIAFGGLYDQTKGTYTFNITRHVQDLMNSKILDGKDNNYGLFLTLPTAEPVLAARAAIDQTKTKLEITYTKLN